MTPKEEFILYIFLHGSTFVAFDHLYLYILFASFV